MGSQSSRLALTSTGQFEDVVQSPHLALLSTDQQLVERFGQRFFRLVDAANPTVPMKQIGDLDLDPLLLTEVVDRFDNPLARCIELAGR